MAGMVFVSETSDWSASSWAFSWVVDTLADRVASAELAQRLREISGFNLASFGLADFPPDQRAELVTQIQALPRVADETLPESSERAGFIAHVRELADAVAAAG